MKAIALALTGLILLAGFGDPASAEEKILNVYNWSDYIGPHTIADFEKKSAGPFRILPYREPISPPSPRHPRLLALEMTV